MKRQVLRILFLFLISSTIYAQEKTQPLTIGVTTLLESKELDETRKINIYLPEDYKETDTTKYPVIYILDGGLEEDFIHITGIVRYNTQPWVNRFPKSIVVGIENTNRRRDFTFPVPDLDFLKKMGFKKEQYPQYGGSSKYINFLE
ncbi:alpha/beta hydrolase-fold protein, partial [Pedobacter sp.]|uniref:alpha/beta hydrolase-fold protein n=1 Tax=Pedobacter sp. TaxID=1411316 RepID=UPI002C2A1198